MGTTLSAISNEV